VWLDEASVDDETNISDLRLATSLSTMCTLQGLVCGKCFSFLPALCSKGTIELDAFEDSMNKEWFISFITKELVIEYRAPSV
jgi:hypothetical protein